MSQQYSSHHLIVRPDARHTFSAKECDVEQEFAFSSRRFGADLKSAEYVDDIYGDWRDPNKK